ncbi:MAG TPA: hypothetical protein PKD55_22655 [Bellilinea sp.]|nr:hypothetical protein [Bellilinea sp.]
MTVWRAESVIAGLEAERGAATDPVALKIAGVRQDGAFLRVRISGTESGGAVLVMHGADGVERRFPTKLVLAPVQSGKPKGRRPGRR